MIEIVNENEADLRSERDCTCCVALESFGTRAHVGFLGRARLARLYGKLQRDAPIDEQRNRLRFYDAKEKCVTPSLVAQTSWKEGTRVVE